MSKTKKSKMKTVKRKMKPAQVLLDIAYQVYEKEMSNIEEHCFHKNGYWCRVAWNTNEDVLNKEVRWKCTDCRYLGDYTEIPFLEYVQNNRTNSKKIIKY